MRSCREVYLVSSRRKVIKSFRSLACSHRQYAHMVKRRCLLHTFFSPPKAIFVPGMYFLGFSRYSNCSLVSLPHSLHPTDATVMTYQCVLLPYEVLALVRVGV